MAGGVVAVGQEHDGYGSAVGQAGVERPTLAVVFGRVVDRPGNAAIVEVEPPDRKEVEFGRVTPQRWCHTDPV